jgi:hypothetical protein
MGVRVIGLYRYPWETAYVNRSSRRRTARALYRKAIWSKANPRDESYMRVLFADRYPDGTFLKTDEMVDWSNEVAAADTIILLYPDSVGLGFAALESTVTRLKKPSAAVRVLNGRRRDFLFTRATRRRLGLRRLLERSMMVEFVVMIAMLLVTPFLIMADLVRGR